MDLLVADADDGGETLEVIYGTGCLIPDDLKTSIAPPPPLPTPSLLTAGVPQLCVFTTAPSQPPPPRRRRKREGSRQRRRRRDDGRGRRLGRGRSAVLAAVTAATAALQSATGA